MSSVRAVGVALAVACGARPASAAELAASGPRECADAREISFRVERSIGMRLAQASPLAFDVVMEPVAAGYVARIAVTGAEPGAVRLTRELRAADCSKLVDAVSVAVALALGAAGAKDEAARAGDADGAASTERANAAEASRPSEATEVPAAAGAPAPSSPAAPPPPTAADGGGEGSNGPSATLAPSISLWLLGDAGSLPSPSLGAGLGVELGWSKLELRALGSLLFEQEVQLDAPSAPSAGAKLQLMMGGLLACAAPFGSSRAPLAPFACFGAEVGQMSGEGRGIASPRRGSALWAAPLVQVGAAWAVPDTALRLALGFVAAAPLTRDQFALRDIGTVHQPPSLVGRLSFGVSVGFD